MQCWVEANLPGFIAAEDWPSGSPGLNPLDYCLWNILEGKAACKPSCDIETSKPVSLTATPLMSNVQTNDCQFFGKVNARERRSL